MEKSTNSMRIRPIAVAVPIIVLAGLLSGCSGQGGGWLPPDNVLFHEQASFGFSFSCERSSNATNLNPKPGRLHIELSYTEHGSYVGVDPIPAGGPFSIHGVADEIDPVFESEMCSGEDPRPDKSRLVFLGTYRVTSASPGQFIDCRSDSSACRFEVTVQDNDRNNAPSSGDDFSITLTGPAGITSTLEELPVYSRGGKLAGGNLTVK